VLTLFLSARNVIAARPTGDKNSSAAEISKNEGIINNGEIKIED
jgi:hypothetical protein